MKSKCKPHVNQDGNGVEEGNRSCQCECRTSEDGCGKVNRICKTILAYVIVTVLIGQFGCLSGAIVIGGQGQKCAIESDIELSNSKWLFYYGTVEMALYPLFLLVLLLASPPYVPIKLINIVAIPFELSWFTLGFVLFSESEGCPPALYGLSIYAMVFQVVISLCHIVCLVSACCERPCVPPFSLVSLTTRVTAASLYVKSRLSGDQAVPNGGSPMSRTRRATTRGHKRAARPCHPRHATQLGAGDETK